MDQLKSSAGATNTLSLCPDLEMLIHETRGDVQLFSKEQGYRTRSDPSNSRCLLIVVLVQRKSFLSTYHDVCPVVGYLYKA